MLTIAFSALIITIIVAASIGGYFFSTRAVARRDGRKLTRSIAMTQSMFDALDQIPNGLITRDLRRGCVLTINHHLGVLARIQPRHPHLYFLQNRLQRLNRLPSGFESKHIRTTADRRRATVALETLSSLIKSAAREKHLSAKAADLATTAASFAAQQIAVETARQAAKDAENVRAYTQALRFAYQAQALCKKLPPLMGKALTDSVSADVDRLESLLGRPARI